MVNFMSMRTASKSRASATAANRWGRRLAAEVAAVVSHYPEADPEDFEDLGEPRLAQALAEVDAAYVPPFGWNPPMLAGRGSEPFGVVIRMDGLNGFAEEWKASRAIKVGKLRLKVLPLDRILASKQAANRPKDQRVIPVLQNTLRTLQIKKARRKQAP